MDLVKLAMGVQLATAAALFYGCEVGLGYDSGDGFRVVSALFLGYFLRIFVKIEVLVSYFGGDGRKDGGGGWYGI
jgi:hypothetical protein